MTVADHLTLNELWRKVKKAKDPIEKLRFLAVYHAKRGLTAKKIAKITLGSTRWVYEAVRRYNQGGPEALKDRRHQNPGQKPKLTLEEQRKVLEALQGPPPDGGLWTGPKLRDWVERELGKKLSLYPIYRLLHEMGFALRVPRPRHAKAEGEAQEAFKNLLAQVQEARARGRRVRLLAYDEHRLGLRPVYRRVWARRGRGPWRWGRIGTAGSTSAPLWSRRRGEPEPFGGRDGHGGDELGSAGAQGLAWGGEEAWVVLDRAGWHVSGRVEVPEGCAWSSCRPTVRSCSRWSGCGPW